MKKLKLLLPTLLASFSLLISQSIPIPAIANPQCYELFRNPSFFETAKAYGSEVAESKGLRLFLKNSDYDGDQAKWYGFLSKQSLRPSKSTLSRYFSSIIDFVPRKLGEKLSREEGYYFTPLAGLYRLTFKMPVEYLTNRFGNKRLEPAFFFKFPVLMALSMSTYSVVDTAYQHQLQAHVNYEISHNSVQYETLIQSDFRYKKIKDALRKGDISIADAQREAYLVSLAYAEYFQYRDSNSNELSFKNDKKLLNHYLFSHLKDVVENGVKKASISDGFDVPDSVVGPISESKASELFNNTHQLYLKYQIIKEMVDQTAVWNEIQASPKLGPMSQNIVNDPFTVEMFQLRDAGKINNFELLSYLQEDAYWQNRFQNWKVIGVTRLKKIDGHYINEPLTLADVRQEILVEIGVGR